LRYHLFIKDQNPDLIDQVIEGDGLTVLRYPKMGDIEWDWEGAGYTATVQREELPPGITGVRQHQMLG
jgi:hypothetical protein